MEPMGNFAFGPEAWTFIAMLGTVLVGVAALPSLGQLVRKHAGHRPRHRH